MSQLIIPSRLTSRQSQQQSRRQDLNPLETPPFDQGFNLLSLSLAASCPLAFTSWRSQTVSHSCHPLLSQSRVWNILSTLDPDFGKSKKRCSQTISRSCHVYSESYLSPSCSNDCESRFFYLTPHFDQSQVKRVWTTLYSSSRPLRALPYPHALIIGTLCSRFESALQSNNLMTAPRSLTLAV